MRPRSHPKILFLTTAEDIGGMQRVVVGLARQFVARGWRVKSVYPRSPRSAALLDWCNRQGVSAETDPAVLNAAAPHTLRALLALRRFVRRRVPDVVNLHYGDNFISLKDLVAVRLSGRCRCIVTVHHPTPWGPGNARKRLMTALAASLAHEIVVVSEATRAVLLEAGVPACKIHVIPCGLRSPDRLPARDEARQRLNLRRDAFVVATLARLVPHKGIDDLIEAVARIPDPAGKLLLVVAGDGPERARLEALAVERLGARALFLGHVPGTTDLYTAADLFALPSYMEGFGLVYVEAAVHGVPSVGTNVGGIPNVVVDGETGLLVAPGVVDALACAIQRLRDDAELRYRMGEAAQARAYAEFTEECMAERYAQVFAR